MVLVDVTRMDTASIPAVDLLIFGSSCKSLSSLNSNRRSLHVTGNALCTSGNTFAGCMTYVEACKPRIVIFENVLGLLTKEVAKPLRVQACVIGWVCLDALVAGKDAPGSGICTGQALTLERPRLPRGRGRHVEAGAQAPPRDIDYVLNKFRNLGYTCGFNVVSAQECLLPQRRGRVSLS
jgi:site-specific DNA-cytosine methylase